MLAQLKQYDEEELKSIYARGSLFLDKKQVKELSTVVTQQQNALTAIVTYNNNILKIADSVKLGSELVKRESILEHKVGITNDNGLDTTNLISSLQNLTDLVGQLSEKLKMTDLSSVPSNIPAAQNKMSLGKVGKTLAVAGVAVAGVSLLSNMSSSKVDQTSDKLGKTANKAVRTAEQRSESIKVSENSFSSQFASFIGNILRYGLFGGVLGTIGGAIGSMINGGGEDYSNLKPAGDSAHAGQAMKFFMDQGWTKEQAAGIVGNLQQESHADLDPNSKNSIGMYGIAQWDTNRRNQFQKNYGKPIYGSSFEEQLNFIQWELTHSHKNAGSALKQAKDAKEAAMIVVDKYEGAKGQDDGKRIANAIALAGGTYEKQKGLNNRNLGVGEAPKGTIWKGRDKDGLITFVSKTNDPRNGKVKYETWTNQDSTHYPISEEDAKMQIQTRGLKSNNATAQRSASQKDAQRSSGYTITGAFGTDRGDHIHGGVDIRASIGTPIYSVMDGTISRSAYSESYGNVIYIDHGNGIQTRYAHLSQRVGSVGQRVSTGQLIGKSGNTGNSEGEHLHFEVRRNGQSINPSGYGNPLNGTPGQATAQQTQPRSQELPKTSTQVAINKAKHRKMAPTIIAKNNIIRQQVKAPTVLSQASGKTNHVRKPMEYFAYLVG